ncbi:MAG: DUF4411 family protein [Methylophilus sp.]|jgi:hypothetical protein
MQTFDASSMIYAWDNYPFEQFPPLWDWMAGLISDGQIVMSSVAFEEVSHKTPDCCEWLESVGLQRVQVSNDILKEALRIKALLGIVDEGYHPKGVDEKDLLIIATAKVNHLPLVSDEEKQPTKPVELKKYKIPLVCGLNTVNLTCLNYLDFIKASKTVFG